MNSLVPRLVPWLRRIGPEVLVLLAVLADVWILREGAGVEFDVLAVIVLISIPLRNRLPLPVCAIAVVAAFANLIAAPVLAVYTVALHFRRLAVPAASAAVMIVAFWYSSAATLIADGAVPSPREAVFVIGYSLAAAGAPFALGRLVRARREIAAQLTELEQSHDEQRRLHETTVLARERAQLAREMHDVVSHQVSLIAVEAGALQVTTADSAAEASARSIRGLAVSTLEELRQMVGVLRASGSHPNGLSPQPTARDIPALLRDSGVRVRLHGHLPEDTSAAIARAVYRTVQEALTNVRKHAPGAAATVRISPSARELTVSIENDASQRVALDLPGSKVGLLGLRERAENLGGSLEAGPTGTGGFRVALTVPHRVT
ncbi:hypothetical protein GCM10027289_21670 [Tsukamurella serpentis]